MLKNIKVLRNEINSSLFKQVEQFFKFGKKFKVDLSDLTSGNKQIRFKQRGNEPIKDEEEIKIKKYKTLEKLDKFQSHVEKFEAMTKENENYIINFINVNKFEKSHQIKNIFKFLFDKFKYQEIKEILQIILKMNTKLIIESSIKNLNDLVKNLLKLSKENNLNFTEEFEIIYTQYKNLLNYSNSTKVFEKTEDFINYIYNFQNYEYMILNEKEIVKLLEIYLTNHKKINLNDKLIILKSFIKFSKTKNFNEIKQENLKEKMELCYFIVINDLRKFSVEKFRSKNCCWLLEIMGFFNCKFENENDWKKLNNLIENFKREYIEEYSRLLELVKSTKTDLKFLNYNLICKIYILNEGKDIEELEISDLKTIIDFYSELIKIENDDRIDKTTQDDLIKKLQNDTIFMLEKSKDNLEISNKDIELESTNKS